MHYGASTAHSACMWEGSDHITQNGHFQSISCFKITATNQSSGHTHPCLLGGEAFPNVGLCQLTVHLLHVRPEAAHELLRRHLLLLPFISSIQIFIIPIWEIKLLLFIQIIRIQLLRVCPWVLFCVSTTTAKKSVQGFVSKKEAISPKILSSAFVKESTSKVTWDSSDDLKYECIFK